MVYFGISGDEDEEIKWSKWDHGHVTSFGSDFVWSPFHLQSNLPARWALSLCPKRLTSTAITRLLAGRVPGGFGHRRHRKEIKGEGKEAGEGSPAFSCPSLSWDALFDHAPIPPVPFSCSTALWLHSTDSLSLLCTFGPSSDHGFLLLLVSRWQKSSVTLTLVHPSENHPFISVLTLDLRIEGSGLVKPATPSSTHQQLRQW